MEIEITRMIVEQGLPIFEGGQRALINRLISEFALADDCSFSSSIRRPLVVGVITPCSIADKRFLMLRWVA